MGCGSLSSLSLWQVRKRTLGSVRLDGSSDSLKLRLDLSQKLSLAERLWRDRLLWFLLESGGLRKMEMNIKFLFPLRTIASSCIGKA
jgi:hypothetical protein